VVAGGFIVGAVLTPDMSRFSRSAADVVKQTAVGVTIGEYVTCLAGVLLARAAQTSDIVSIGGRDQRHSGRDRIQPDRRGSPAADHGAHPGPAVKEEA
jgi:hypothetical protein